jgi:hypothetical protein
MMKIALLCSGLGNVYRGHEVFARDLFTLLGDSVDLTLFKGGGEAASREVVVDNLPRNAPCLDHVHVAASAKWAASVRQEERSRIEAETFAYAALKPLIEGEFEIISNALSRTRGVHVIITELNDKRSRTFSGSAAPVWTMTRWWYKRNTCGKLMLLNKNSINAN